MLQSGRLYIGGVNKQKIILMKDMYNRLVGKWIDTTKYSNQSQAEKDKRVLELSHLASFIIALWDFEIIKTIEEIEVIDLTLQPDFIIQHRGEFIGIELARIKNDRAQEVGSLKNILKNSAKVFRQKYPNISILANIEFLEESDIFNHDKESTYNTIADVVYHSHTRNNRILPYYITHLNIMKHTQVDFNLSGAYWCGLLDFELVNGVIENKESKIDDYRIGCKLDKIWLLLIVSGASADSNYSYIPFDKINGSGKFDSIFLLNDFLKKVYKLNNL